MSGYNNPPSSRPMTLRQQLEQLMHAQRVNDSMFDEGSEEWETNRVTLIDQYEALCQEIAREARIDENQRWANGYSSAILDNPTITDVAGLRAAKGDFEDRIRQLTQKPPQPPQADSHTDIGDIASGNEAVNSEEAQ